MFHKRLLVLLKLHTLSNIQSYSDFPGPRKLLVLHRTSTPADLTTPQRHIHGANP
jgi:hypothetical protein